ncbi:MAG: pyruvate kinase, partial [Deltaproteobacteria bacterium]|nr:pyruvate kinase [Deltaproteobacteria bacterium]
MRRCKILCTLGPSSSDDPTLQAMVEAGMDAVRLNFSHGTIEQHRRALALVRRIAEQTGRPLPVVQDLQGPKIRVGDLGPPGVELVAGEELLLTVAEQPGEEAAIPVSYAALPQDVRPGDPLLLDDGLLQLEVREVVDERRVRCRVVIGGHLSSHKGINLPGVPLSTPALTEKDHRDLQAGLAMGVDWVALSFVRRAEDVLELRRTVARAGARTQILAKIEKPEALPQLPAILDAADGILVARGDLGVEVPPQRVPLLQLHMVHDANAKGKLVVIATQMLDSMIRNVRPTRAEVTDVATAVMQGADATMLSGETATGAHPVEAVRMMAAIIEEVEAGQRSFGPQVEPALIPGIA